MKLSLKKYNNYQDIKNIFLIFLSIVTSLSNLNMPFLMASISNNENLNGELIKSDSIVLSSDYIVDTGDILNINFEGIPIFSKQYNVDFEGFLYLPEIYKLKVKGMTTKEIESLLRQKYREFIKDPVIRINLASPREVNIFIHGEVNKPGLYTLSYRESSKVNDQNNNIGIGIGIDAFKNESNILGNPTKNLTSTVKTSPKLYQAIQIAKGINNFSDLTDVQVIRNNSISQGGGKITTSINFLSLLKTGDQSLNIELRDGDTIFIPKSKTSFKKQFFDLNSINLNPDFISVYLNGNLRNTGYFKIPANSSLNDAIAFGGGKNFKTGRIRLIRLQDDNKVKRLSFNYVENAKKGSRNNPYLVTGDIVVVNKNLLGKTNTILSEIGSPIINAYGILSLFD